MNFHNMSKEEVMRQVAKMRGTGGKNRLDVKKKKSIFSRFLAQFSDFMILVLLVAAAVSFGIAMLESNGDFIDPIIILVIVVLNAVIGVIEESRADNALEALKQMSSPTAKIRRDGKEITIDAQDVKIGDTLLLKAGDRVSADARLIKCIGMEFGVFVDITSVNID